ncbi:MAG: radical SAM protein [Pseudomonadota bacterium]
MTSEQPIDFEVGPIRPPNEANSLLVRVTRNCPWNHCTFCPVYKGQKFSLRTVEEVKTDIRSMAAIAEQIKELSLQIGQDGEMTSAVLRALPRQNRNMGAAQVVLFLRDGGRTAFLQDANSVIMPVAKLMEILECLRECFPSIQRITSYARSHTLIKRSVEELRQLREAGLNRIHVGLESGSNRVLEMAKKGVTAEQHIRAGLRVKEAGIGLSEYVMPGLGGKALSKEHAIETAKVLCEIDPDFIRLRTLAIAPGSPLAKKYDQKEFEPLGDVEIATELRLMLNGFKGMSGTVRSDHILNLLGDVDGILPEDLPKMLSLVDRFLELNHQEQEVFVVGRRLGFFRNLDDLQDPDIRSRALIAVAQLRKRFPGPINSAIREIMTRFV